MWRLVKLSLVGPTGQDLKKCRTLLQQEHQALVQGRLAKKPFQERFRPNLDGTSEGVGMDGNALKAYVIIAECHLAGITKSEDIISVLAEKSAGSETSPEPSKRFDWLGDREERGHSVRQSRKESKGI